jgi:hypothetical protein
MNTAASSYIQTNAAVIKAIATPSTPATITVAMLQAASVNLLPSTFSPLNPYAQTWEVQVLQPVTGTLQGLVLSTGGTVLKDKQLNRIASLIGAQGGFIPENDSTLYAANTAYGSGGAWTVSTANYTGAAAGHLSSLLMNVNGQTQSPFLYRNAVAGQPQLNTMNTPLIMGVTEIIGNVCSPIGAIAQDGAGALLSCQTSGLWTLVGGLWQAPIASWTLVGGGSWKTPVASFAALPAASNTLGDVRLTTDFNRAYAWNGAAWNALAIDQNGNISIPGTATMANAVITGAATMANAAITGTATMANAVITGTATVGNGCPTNGTVAQDGTGLLLSCQSGVWKKAQGSSGTGISGILLPLAGKTISCFISAYWPLNYPIIAYAMIDATGNPFTRITTSYLALDTGWVSGFTATIPNEAMIATWQVGSFPSLVLTSNLFTSSATCTANWPMI